MADSDNNKRDSESCYQVITAECDAMLRYAMGSGRALSPAVVEHVASAVAWIKAQSTAEQLSPAQLEQAKAQAPSIGKLSRTHQRLAQVIAPAQPRPLRLMHEVAGYDASNLWMRMPMPRNMTIVAIVSIVMLIAVGTSPLLSPDPAAGNPMLSSGPTLLINQLFFLSIASLGSCFHGLFKVNEYIVRGNYDPDYSSTYWVRYMLGVISGLILASLIAVDKSSALYSVARPLLALVGGFSAAVVHRVLDRLVNTVEDLISGDPKKRLEGQQQLAQAKTGARIRDARVDAASKLMKLQAKLQDGMKPEDARAEITALVHELMPEGDDDDDDDEPSVAVDVKPRVNGAAAPAEPAEPPN